MIVSLTPSPLTELLALRPGGNGAKSLVIPPALRDSDPPWAKAHAESNAGEGGGASLREFYVKT